MGHRMTGGPATVSPWRTTPRIDRCTLIIVYFRIDSLISLGITCSDIRVAGMNKRLEPDLSAGFPGCGSAIR